MQSVIFSLKTQRGSTCFPVYAELVRKHQEEGLSFKNCHAFVVHEYFPLPQDSVYSTHKILNAKFFDKVDFPVGNINFLRGDIAASEIRSYCDKFEKKIKNLGGIDFQILGVGSGGHLGLNEPGSKFQSVTRKVTLDT